MFVDLQDIGRLELRTVLDCVWPGASHNVGDNYFRLCDAAQEDVMLWSRLTSGRGNAKD